MHFDIYTYLKNRDYIYNLVDNDKTVFSTSDDYQQYTDGEKKFEPEESEEKIEALNSRLHEKGIDTVEEILLLIHNTYNQITKIENRVEEIDDNVGKDGIYIKKIN